MFQATPPATAAGARHRPHHGGWLVSPRPNPTARLRLFCFPYAAGNANIFMPWARLLPESIELIAVQPPGRAERLRETPHHDLKTFVDELAVAVEPSLDRPFAFFGHSMGALVAFELARVLRQKRGVEPTRLIVSGHRAPHLPYGRAPIHDRPEAELVAQLRRLNGTPPEVLEHAELLELLLPVIRADFAVCETYRYRPGPALGCPIIALGGLEDKDVPREELTAWGEQTTASCSVRMLPGDHFFVNTARQHVLHVIARELSARP